MSDGLRLVPTAAEGLALEAALFDAATPGVAVWSARAPALVCPAPLIRRTGLPAKPVFQGWPIFARPTGGGVVPQGPGILNLAISYCTGPGTALDTGYRSLARILTRAVAHHAPELSFGPTPHSFCDGAWNLMVAGRKVGGTAQRWRPLPNGGGHRVLAHAVLLITGDSHHAASVIAAFHARHDLPPVDPNVHATLSALATGPAPTVETLARTLIRAGRSELSAETPSRAVA